MIAVNGIYENGIIRLDRKILAKKTFKVIVTFLDDEFRSKTKRLTTKDFSFQNAREKSRGYQGSLSDAVIEDREAEL